LFTPGFGEAEIRQLAAHLEACILEAEASL
jgi:hypothetical protein